MSRSFQFNGQIEDDSSSKSNGNPLHPHSTHARFTSRTEFSRGVCSIPRSPETENLGMDAPPLDFQIPPQHAQGDPHEQIFYRGRNSYSSGLDCDGDTTSANGSLSSGNEPESDAGDNDSTQISLRGPKIRFHSRAPWEMDDVPEGDESDHSKRSNNAVVKSGRKKTSKADTLIRTLTRGSRPSAESSYSLTMTSKVPLQFFAGTSSRRSL